MTTHISRKFVTTADGPWLSLVEVPSKILLEVDDGEGNPSGKPAIKIDSTVFHFGQKHDKPVKYRVLALNTVVVCTQE